jgi:hypothetical protein
MSFWPFFDLTVRTPLIELRGATDALLEEAAALHATGIAPPGAEPIDGDASMYYASPEHEWHFLKGYWGARAKTSRDWWFTPFVVLFEGQLVGMQEMVASSSRRAHRQLGVVARSLRGPSTARRCAQRSCTSPEGSEHSEQRVTYFSTTRSLGRAARSVTSERRPSPDDRVVAP